MKFNCVTPSTVKENCITSILAYMPDVVYIKNVQERYLLVNSRFEELFGIKNKAVRRKTAHEFMSQALADQIQMSDCPGFFRKENRVR